MALAPQHFGNGVEDGKVLARPGPGLVSTGGNAGSAQHLSGALVVSKANETLSGCWFPLTKKLASLLVFDTDKSACTSVPPFVPHWPTRTPPPPLPSLPNPTPHLLSTPQHSPPPPLPVSTPHQTLSSSSSSSFPLFGIHPPIHQLIHPPPPSHNDHPLAIPGRSSLPYTTIHSSYSTGSPLH